MPYEIKAWRCDHCRATRLTKRAIEKHEGGCIASEANRACKTCMFDQDEGRGFSCTAGVDKKGKKVIRHCGEWVDRNGEAE